MADEFEMDDLSRLPPRPSRPVRPRSQMFEEPLHIQHDMPNDMGDPMGDMGFGIPNADTIPHFGPPDAGLVSPADLGRGGPMAPGMMGPGMMGPSMGGGYFGGSPGGYAMPAYPVSDTGPLQKCLIGFSIVVVLLMLIALLGLAIWILVKTYDISDDLNNLRFRIRVPPPPASTRQ